MYTAEQANKLLEVIHGEVLEPVIMLGLLFGMRRSEALGLRLISALLNSGGRFMPMQTATTQSIFLGYAGLLRRR